MRTEIKLRRKYPAIFNQKKQPIRILFTVIGFLFALVLTSCAQIAVSEYNAIAVTTYTWRAEYFISRNEKTPRTEKFASTSLVNFNGNKPESAFGGQDDRGLWWPTIPPKPTLEQLEELEKPGEQHSRPELLRTVKYRLQYRENNKMITLPTNYSVYRQAVKAYRRGLELKLTLGLNNKSVEKAEPQTH